MAWLQRLNAATPDQCYPARAWLCPYPAAILRPGVLKDAGSWLVYAPRRSSRHNFKAFRQFWRRRPHIKNGVIRCQSRHRQGAYFRQRHGRIMVFNWALTFRTISTVAGTFLLSFDLPRYSSNSVSGMLATFCHRDDWSLLIPTSESLGGSVASDDLSLY